MFGFLFIFIIFHLLSLVLAQGEICVICNCAFVNVSRVEPESGDSLRISFKYKAEAIEPFNVNTTYEAKKKYFYVDCSSENNVGQINNLDWPKVKVLGIFANFRNSKWKKLELFPENIKYQMTVLSLTSNLISEIEDFELDDFASLKMLNLSENQLEIIKKGTFSKLSYLRILDLSTNWIKEMEDWSFYGTQLQFLNLSRNHITYLTPDVFRGLNNLTVLDLSENRLGKLPDEFGNSLPSLRFLTLNKNGFEKLPELPKELKKFEVAHNRLVDLHLSHSNLEILDVSFNELMSLEHTSFSNLKILRASNNNLTQLINLRNNKIKILQLSFNKFHKIPEVVTSDKLPFLEELYLDGNPITNITFPPQSEPFTNLRIVSLSNLKSLKKILKNSFQGVFPKIDHDCSVETGRLLNFSHNSIKFVDKDAFNSISICSIDFSHNSLRTLSENLLPWKKMSHVNLQENPWHCDCNIQWMLDELMYYMYENQPRLLFGLRCETPLRYQNKMFVYWYNKSEQVFCNSGPSSFYLDLIGGKKVEIWTASAIVCVILACIIVVTTIVLIVLVFTRPKNKTREKTSKKKGPPYYKKIPGSEKEKNQELSEKWV